MAIPYYHVDAFTSELFAGNPAGVCILSAFLPDSTLQKIAAENRHSKTAFVVPREDGDFDLRWFTPKVEDDLCGHATLASAYVLTLRKHNVWPVRFHTCSGMLTVAQKHDGFEPDSFEMDFPAKPPQPCETPVEFLPALGLKTAVVMKSRDRGRSNRASASALARFRRPRQSGHRDRRNDGYRSRRGWRGLRMPIVCTAGRHR
jgi:PhzF family phenazine biosynthesis protein